MNEQEFAALPPPVALVVDDEPLILMDTADIIADAGFYVLEAKTADEAFAFLKQHSSLRLVFTDVQMPGEMDGIDLARHIGEHWPQIAVIVASGAVVPDEGVLPANATFMSKPISAVLVRDILLDLRRTDEH